MNLWREVKKQVILGEAMAEKKKKVVCAVELTESAKVKRFYALKINYFSAKSLKPIFDHHIFKDAKVATDE